MNSFEQVGDPYGDSAAGGSNAQPGASARFMEFYDRHAAAVYGIAAYVLGDGTRAEAVAEEVFVRAWRAGAERRRDWNAPREHQHPADIWLLRLTHALALEDLALMAKPRGETREERNDLPIAAEAELHGEALTLKQRDMLYAIFWRGVTLADLAKESDQTSRELAKEVRTAMARLQSLEVTDQDTVGSSLITSLQ